GNDQVLPTYELAVIPDVVAIQFLATKTMNSVDTALILKDRQQIVAMQEYFQRMATRAKPLLQVFPPTDWISLETLRAEAEEQYGARVLVKDGLSRLTEPPSWANSTVDRARMSAQNEDSLSVLIEARKRRLAAFETHVGHSRY